MIKPAYKKILGQKEKFFNEKFLWGTSCDRCGKKFEFLDMLVMVQKIETFKEHKEISFVNIHAKCLKRKRLIK